MRLSPEDIVVIRTLVQARFGPSAGIWLFGSRLDESARGGDIDLYVEPDRLPDDNLFLARQALQHFGQSAFHASTLTCRHDNNVQGQLG